MSNKTYYREDGNSSIIHYTTEEIEAANKSSYTRLNEADWYESDYDDDYLEADTQYDSDMF